MDNSRRQFLKLAGLSALGVAGASTVKLASDAHATGTASAAGPPGAKRLAMVIDLRKFDKDGELAKRCVEACHRVHNVPDFERPKDQIKWIWTDDFELVFHDQGFHDNDMHFLRKDLEGKPTLLLCNHCDNAPCARVCPTEATWKRASDGVVMMDWHRCVGCRYCILACPYGSRSFNWRDPRTALDEDKIDPTFPTRMRGVVEKCNFCEERLAKDALPACVEVCGNDEIIFGDLNDSHSRVREILEEHLAIRRKPGLGTQPEVYYIVDDPRTISGARPAAASEPVLASDADTAAAGEGDQ